MKRFILGTIFFAIGVFGAFITACDIANATTNEVFSRNDYIGNGVATGYAYGFKILQNTDIEVIQDGTVKTLTTHYTVSGAGLSGGGTVTFVSIPAVGSKITLLRKQPHTQQSTYIANEPYPASRIMADFDKGVMLDQQHQEQLNRSLHVSKGTQSFNTEITPTVGGVCVQVNATVTGFTLGACGGGGGGGGTVDGTGANLQVARWISTTTLSGGNDFTFNAGLLNVGTGTPFSVVDAMIAPKHMLVALGSAASPDTSKAPQMLFTRFISQNPTDCNAGLDPHCNAVIEIETDTSVTNQVQPVGLFIQGRNQATTGTGLVGTPGAGNADYAGIYVVAMVDTAPTVIGAGSTTPYKQTVAAYLQATRTVAGTSPQQVLVHPLELRTDNATATDCDASLDTNNQGADCLGIALFSGGGTATKHGIGMILGSVEASKNRFQRGYTCMGALRGPTESCYDDATDADQSINIRGNYIYGVNLSLGVFSGPSILLKSGGQIGWNTGATLPLIIGSSTLITLQYGATAAISVDVNDKILKFHDTGSKVVQFRAPTTVTTSHTNVFPADVCLSGQMWKSDGGTPTQVWACANDSGAGGGVATVTGTANRITLSGTGADPIVDIAATYVGQTSITTLGTVTAGVWAAGNVTTALVTSPIHASTTSLTFKINTSTTAVTVDTDGDVGIGTTTPGARLVVQGNGSFAQGMRLQWSGSTSNWAFAQGGDGKLYVGYGLVTAETVFAIFDTAGRLAIGNIVPGSLLHIVTGGGMQVGAPAGGNIANAINAAGGFYENGVKIGASGIIGSGVANQCTFWIGPSQLDGDPTCTFNPTTVSLALTKSTTNNIATQVITTAVAGNRSTLGSVSIPTGTYGSTGPGEVTYVTGLALIDTDGTHWPDGVGSPGFGTINNAAGAAGLVVSKNFTSTFSGIGSSVILNSLDTRNPATATNIEQDHSNIWALLVGNSGGAGTQGIVNSTNVFLLTTRLSAINYTTGMQIIMSNYINGDVNSNGLLITAGDAANLGTEYINGDAIAIGTTNNHTGSLEAWTNAIKFGTRFVVAGSGVTTILPSVDSQNQLTVASKSADANGVAIKLTHTGGTGNPSKFIMVLNDELQIRSAARADLFSITDAGVIKVLGGATFNGTKTVRASGGAADCTLVFTHGLLTGGTC